MNKKIKQCECPAIVDERVKAFIAWYIKEGCRPVENGLPFYIDIDLRNDTAVTIVGKEEVENYLVIKKSELINELARVENSISAMKRE